MSEAVVLAGVRDLLRGVETDARHPGLTLDKFSPPGTQKEQKPALDPVCQAKGDPVLLCERGAQRDTVLGDTGAKMWEATTSGPLTLHLSRANALENAGIALHPLYGFAHLPGSGLKGVARAYAETIWLAAQPETDKTAAHEQIIAVFGCAPGSDGDKAPLPDSLQNAKDSRGGAVVFHDAWPKTWPMLFVDIAAIHHPDYYQASEEKVPPPGDWETPTLISFLAIQPGTTFRFAVAPRARTVDRTLVALAKDWLNSALVTLGVGAKTAAGYGLFKTDVAPLAVVPSNRAEAGFELKLVTPAFLAGAAQNQEDCDLRGATLRGQLRWWWRTMHAAHLEPATLRRLESAVWGASSEGSAVQIRLAAKESSTPKKYDFKSDGRFIIDNQLQRPERGRIQGVSYLSYGMADKPESVRYYRQPNDCWTLQLVSRGSEFRQNPKAKRGTGVAIDASLVLAQATAALSLLARYGGVGAKGRKGFGSFDGILLPDTDDLNAVKQQAAKLRLHCKLSDRVERTPSVSTLEGLLVEEVPLGWTNAWHALDSLGLAYQEAVKMMMPALKGAKVLLGMPRTGVQDARPRLASALHLHLARSTSGLTARIATFDLPGINTNSKMFLEAVRTAIKKKLEDGKELPASGRAALYPPRAGLVAGQAIDQAPPSVRSPDDGKPRVGGRVQAELLAEKTKNGGWRARDRTSGTERSIQNTRLVPADKKAGDTVELEVPNHSEFKWPVPPPPARPTAPPRGGPRGRR